MQTS
jgi:hypothetical protein